MELVVEKNRFSPRHLGFSSHFEGAFEPFRNLGLRAGRVAAAQRGHFTLLVEDGEIQAELAGRLRRDARSAADLPAVGDWVAFREHDGGTALVRAVLPRRTLITRGAAGRRTEIQVLAANVDLALLVCALDRDFSVRRVERYLTVAHASGADALVVLMKADLCAAEPELAARRAEVEAVAGAVPVLAVSALTGLGLDALDAQLEPGKTLALFGSSGAGKSTLVNRFLGAEQAAVAPLGAGGRGQHTTTRRDLLCTPSGALVLDTPGMRELRIWEDEGALDETFSDVASLAAGCRFRDCTHRGEPGCRVQTALSEGTLDQARWESFAKLEREAAALAARKDARAGADAKRRGKALARAIRAKIRDKG